MVPSGDEAFDPRVDALFDAAWKDDADSVTDLLDQGTRIGALGSRGLPALYAATENNSLRAFHCLLARGASVHTYGNEENWTPLSHAVEYEVLCVTDDVTPELETNLIVPLLSRGADPRVDAPPLRCSPLEYAHRLAEQGNTRKLGERLLELFREG